VTQRSTSFRDLEAIEDVGWITKKAARLGAYQQLADQCFDLLDRGWDENLAVANKLVRTIQTCLRAVAEEQGDIPTRVTSQVEGNVEYRIVGVNPTDVT
jgi:hypothetical protein